MNTLFKLCSSLAIASALVCAPVNANQSQSKLEPYHTFTQTYYKDNKIIDKYLGDLVAVKGKVLKIEKGPENKIIFQVKLDNVDRTLWVATIMNVLENAIKVGDKTRILGFFDETKLEPQYVAKISKDKEYLLGFCFHIDNSGLPIYHNGFMHRCVDWENGRPFNEETQIVNQSSEATAPSAEDKTEDKTQIQN